MVHSGRSQGHVLPRRLPRCRRFCSGARPRPVAVEQRPADVKSAHGTLRNEASVSPRCLTGNLLIIIVMVTFLLFILNFPVVPVGVRVLPVAGL